VTVEAYPLSWPDGWPRHEGTHDSDTRFKGPSYRWDRVVNGLIDELERIGATEIVISSNQPIRKDGYPYAQERSLSDTGVAVYFMRDGRAMVMAQDRFRTVIGNIRSLAMAVEGLRQMERHGGAVMMERAFAGFVAIAPPGWKKPWREVFGVAKDWRGDVTALFRQKARERHPDSGGSDTLMAELNVAFGEAKAELGNGR
jgi:hypothetical protein